METDVNGATSFSDVDLEAPQSNFSKFIDIICPYFLMYGMTWDEFWNESIERLPVYWQMYQFNRERRNEELWMQGIYIQAAVATVLDHKHRVKYPEKPHRLTAMTEAEKEAENKKKVDRFREQLLEIKRRSDARNAHKGES